MLKQPTDFIAEVTLRYSDDTAQAAEQRFAFKAGMSIEDFMNQCHKMYSVMRYTCGIDVFDSLTEEKKEETKETE